MDNKKFELRTECLTLTVELLAIQSQLSKKTQQLREVLYKLELSDIQIETIINDLISR